MEVQISWIGVIAATVLSMFVGALWYSPFVFGKQWQKLAQISDKQLKQGGNKGIFVAAIGGLITAYILAHVTYLSAQFYTDVSFTMSGVLTGFYLWLGISATTLVIHDGFELKPPKLTMIKLASQLVTLLVMGLTIGIIGV